MRYQALLALTLGLSMQGWAADTAGTVPGTAPAGVASAPADSPVWIPGNWEWTGSAYVWRVGHWKVEAQAQVAPPVPPAPPASPQQGSTAPTFVWVEGRWLKDLDNRWVWVPAHAESTQPGQQPPPPPTVAMASPSSPPPRSAPAAPTTYVQQAQPTVVYAQSSNDYQESGGLASSIYYVAPSYTTPYASTVVIGGTYGGGSYGGGYYAGYPYNGYCSQGWSGSTCVNGPVWGHAQVGTTCVRPSTVVGIGWAPILRGSSSVPRGGWHAGVSVSGSVHH